MGWESVNDSDRNFLPGGRGATRSQAADAASSVRRSGRSGGRCSTARTTDGRPRTPSERLKSARFGRAWGGWVETSADGCDGAATGRRRAADGPATGRRGDGTGVRAACSGCGFRARRGGTALISRVVGGRADREGRSGGCPGSGREGRSGGCPGSGREGRSGGCRGAGVRGAWAVAGEAVGGTAARGGAGKEAGVTAARTIAGAAVGGTAARGVAGKEAGVTAARTIAGEAVCGTAARRVAAEAAA